MIRLTNIEDTFCLTSDNELVEK